MLRSSGGLPAHVAGAFENPIGFQRADNGLYYATPSARISTGLAIGPDSPGADFFYYHWPHLGATAWIALAATGFNPFTGKTAAAGAIPSCPT